MTTQVSEAVELRNEIAREAHKSFGRVFHQNGGIPDVERLTFEQFADRILALITRTPPAASEPTEADELAQSPSSAKKKQ